MHRRTLNCVAVAAALSFPSIALCQADPIDALLKQERLASVPLDCQTDIQPGSYIAVLPDSSTACGVPGTLGHGYDLTFPAVLPIATVGGLSLDLKKGGNLIAKIIGYQIGGALTSTSTLTSDQAIFSVAKLNDEKIDTIVLDDPATQKFFDKYAGTRGATVYIVQTVYRTKSLNITAGDAKGVALANGKAATSCTVADPTPKEKAIKAANDNAAPAAAQEVAKAANANAPSATAPKAGKTGKKTVGTVAGDVGTAAIAALSKDLSAAAANAVTSAAAAAATPVSVSGDVCKTSEGTYVLQSQTEVVVGLKVGIVNNFRNAVPLFKVNHNPWTLGWSPINPQPVLK